MLSFAAMESTETVVIGAGHAGLAISKLLGDSGAEHVVLDRSRIAARWRDERWDSFTLLTPNWATWLPGWHYDGADPHGFMVRDEVVSYFERYARSFGAPVRGGVDVRRLDGAPAGGYRLETSAGPIVAGSVVIATGPFQRPRIPAWSAQLPEEVVQLHSNGYRSAAALPDGAVLVVGSGPSGQQIVEDLQRAGRKVYLAVGRHQRVPRRYRGRDYYWWYELGGFYERTADDVPETRRRGGVAPVLTGFNGGHDLDLRHLHAEGATLLGRAIGFAAGKIQFAPGLMDSLAAGDRAYDSFVDWVESRLIRFDGLFDEAGKRESFPDPPEPRTELDVSEAGVSSVVWATGFRPDYASWVRLDVLDETGFPVHRRGVTALPGVYFIGLPWLHRQRSPFIRGAEEDARHVAAHILASSAAAT
jgi:Predicted flavoprotein involved in K+ transport